MKKNSENQILKIIKFAPPIFIIFLGLILSSLLYTQQKNILLQETQQIKEELIKSKKNEIKNQVNFVNNFINNSREEFILKLREKVYFDAMYNQSLAEKTYSKNKDKSKVEIIAIIKKELENLKITNNPVVVSQNKDRNNLLETFFEKKEIKSNNISYTKNFAPLGIYINTTLRIKDFENILQKELIKEIRKFDFGKDRYIFMLDYKSNFLVHINKKIEGQNILEGNYTQKRKDEIKELVLLAQKGGGFISYTQFKKPSTNELTDKTSYILGFNNWSWIIGTGFYHDDINLSIKNETKKLNDIFAGYMQNAIIATGFLTLLMILLSIYFSRSIRNKFACYKEELEEQNEKNRLTQKMLAHQTKMAAIGEMIGNIAHQWRQPLTVISMCANNIKVDIELGDTNESRFQEYTRDILIQTNYLSNTIDDFRSFFHSEEKISNFTLKEAYSHAYKIINMEFKGQHITIIENIEDIEVSGIFNEFIQVIINILNNSRDAFIEAKIREDRLIFLDTSQDEEFVYFHIKDNAGGVSERIIEKVFEPYFTTKHQSKGTGIGLFMSKEIIEKHMNGELSIQNTQYEYNNKNYSGAMMTIQVALAK